MKAPFAVACLLLLAGSASAQEKPKEPPKPEIKQVSALGIGRGKTVSLLLFGENLSPQTASLATRDGKTAIAATVTLVGGVEATTTDDEKKRGSQRVKVDVAVPADCAPGVYALTLLQADGAKATIPLAVWEIATAESEIKRPNNTFARAMPLEGAWTAITGTLTTGDAPDVYRWNARRGETWEIACLAGGAGSSLDAIVRLRDTRHLPLALSAGDEKQDRRLSFQAPRDGTYFVEVSDAEGRAGDTFRYRLTLRQLTPAARPTEPGKINGVAP